MDSNLNYSRRFINAIQKIDGAYYFLSKKLDINENTLVLLYVLDDGDPHSQKQICDDWAIPKTTINTIVKEFVQLGYVKPSSEPHTKEKIIVLTDSGKVYADKILKRVYELEQRAMEKVLQKFSPDFIDVVEFFADRIHNEILSQE